MLMVSTDFNYADALKDTKSSSFNNISIKVQDEIKELLKNTSAEGMECVVRWMTQESERYET